MERLWKAMNEYVRTNVYFLSKKRSYLPLLKSFSM
ncbi:hypothetical protein [Vibrio mimicus]